MADPTNRLETIWRRLSPIPGGRWLFARILGFMVPYSGSVRPRFHELEPGRAVVSIRERRGLRNHLGSVHAIALANLGELSSGLAMTMALPDTARGIPVGIDIRYHKKARGTITALGQADPPQEIHAPRDHPATAILTNDAGEVVAEMTVNWRLGPNEEKRESGNENRDKRLLTRDS